MHGDHFVVAGPHAQVEHSNRNMQEWYEVKLRAVLGWGPRDCREIVVLCRLVKWEDGHAQIEAGGKIANGDHLCLRQPHRAGGAGGGRCE